MSDEYVINKKIRFHLEFGILKRNYCCICGNKFKRKIIHLRNIYKYRPFCLPFLKERKASSILITPVYYCKNCDYLIDYDEQKNITQLQKQYNTHVLENGKTLIKKHKVK